MAEVVNVGSSGLECLRLKCQDFELQNFLYESFLHLDRFFSCFFILDLPTLFFSYTRFKRTSNPTNRLTQVASAPTSIVHPNPLPTATMSGMLPMAMFGQEVIPDDVAVIAGGDVPAAFRITMAAIDPTAAPLGDEGVVPRATLKIIRQPLDASDMYDEDDSDDSEDFDADEMDAMLGGNGDDSEDEDEDEDANGGPSDPSKTKQARVIAALKKLGEVDGMDVDDDDDDDEVPKTNGVNGVSKSVKAKGKMPASDEDEDEEVSDDGEDEIEEFVICTLDPEKVRHLSSNSSLSMLNANKFSELPTDTRSHDR